MFNSEVLLYVLLGFVLIVIIQLVVRLLEVRAWIRTKANKGVMVEVAYLKYNKGEASEVFLSGGNNTIPISRVTLGTSRDDKGYVEILSSHYEEASAKPVYRPCGYVTPEGYIYKKVGKNGRPERIGYTARPSKPDTPTSIGERSWRTLWLVCTLNAYLGKPEIEHAADSTTKSNSDNNKSVAAFHSLTFNNDASTNDTTDEHKVSTNEDTAVVNTALQEEESVAQVCTTEEEAPSEEQSAVIVDSKDSAQEKDSKEEQQDQDKAKEIEDNHKEAKEDNKEQKEGKKRNKEKDKKKKARKIMPNAVIRHYGFHRSKNDFLSPECRAGAFALFYEKYNKNNYVEYYKDKPYGWADTALLSAFVYSLLYLIGYALVTFVWKKPFIGTNIEVALEFGVFYFVLWALIRFLKIYSIESLNSIQPKLDLFNKSLGHKFMDWAIIGLCLFSFSFFGNYYLTLDWAPLIFAIFMGILVNSISKSAKEPWVIKDTLYDNEDIDEEEDEEPKNPEGDISRTYDWDLDSPVSETKLHGSLTLYFTASTITDIRQMNPFFAQLKERSDKEYIIDMFHYMKEHKSMLARLRYVSYYISKLCRKHDIHELERIQFILDFVQEPNIKFCLNRESEVINRFEDYIRYPDETLYDKEGDSNSKALLAAMLFHLMKHNVLYLHSRKQRHAAIGVEISPEWLKSLGSQQTIDEMTVDYNGKKYIFCETTGDKFRIVDVMQGMHYDDFEERIDLPFIEDDVDDANTSDTQETRIYNWDLDSILGNKLHGSYTLEFDALDIQQLREHNPFSTYGQDSSSYLDNIQKMINYQRQDEENVKNVRAIAKYIKQRISEAGLPELDLVQFALDFVQAPNITYCVDENSAGIEYTKEYMRFPDEVLYDKEGDCDCKSSLTAALFHELGYNVIFMLSEKIGHAAIGIECKDEWLQQIADENPERVLREYNGKRYLYCETTGDGYKIGHIKENDSIQDFETILEIVA